MSQIEEYWIKLDGYGAEKVRMMIAGNQFNQKHKAWAEEWLNNRQRKHEVTADERQELRESEALELSREANKSSKTSNLIALAALIVAILAFYFSIKK